MKAKIKKLIYKIQTEYDKLIALHPNMKCSCYENGKCKSNLKECRFYEGDKCAMIERYMK